MIRAGDLTRRAVYSPCLTVGSVQNQNGVIISVVCFAVWFIKYVIGTVHIIIVFT